MIRKFPAVPRFSIVLPALFAVILAGAFTLHAQETPAQQSPDQQPKAQQPDTQSGNQEATPEEIPTRKPKGPEYKKWSFNVGGGASLTNGDTKNYVRGGGGIIAAGAARNYSKYFGLRLDLQWDNLPLRSSALQLAQAPGANEHVYSVMLGPVINIPVTKNWGGYIIGGAAFYHRSGKLDSSTAIPGTACNGFFLWWGHCFNGSLPINGNFLHSSVNQLGEDFGGGVTRKIRPNMDLYLDFRYLHGTNGNISTDLRPITVGIRW